MAENERGFKTEGITFWGWGTMDGEMFMELLRKLRSQLIVERGFVCLVLGPFGSDTIDGSPFSHVFLCLPNEPLTREWELSVGITKMRCLSY